MARAPKSPAPEGFDPSTDVVETPDPNPVSAYLAETSEGSAFVPVDGQTSREGTPATRVAATSAYLLTHDPRRWSLMAGRVVPNFKKLKLIAGVNGVDEIRRNDGSRVLRAATARALAEERGETVIPLDAIPDRHRHRPDLHQGPPGTAPSYLWRPRGRPDVTLLIYERCYPGAETTDCDVKHYLEFIDHLLSTGIVKPCPAHTLRRMRESAVERMGRLEDLAARFPSYAPDVARTRGEIETIDAELAKREHPRAPELGGAYQPEAL